MQRISNPDRIIGIKRERDVYSSSDDDSNESAAKKARLDEKDEIIATQANIIAILMDSYEHNQQTNEQLEKKTAQLFIDCQLLKRKNELHAKKSQILERKAAILKTLNAHQAQEIKWYNHAMLGLSPTLFTPPLTGESDTRQQLDDMLVFKPFFGPGDQL